MAKNGVVPIKLQPEEKPSEDHENEKTIKEEVDSQHDAYEEQFEVKINAKEYESDEEKVVGQEINLEFLNDVEEVVDQDQESNSESATEQSEQKTKERERESEKEITMEFLDNIDVVSTDQTTKRHLKERLNISDEENDAKQEINMNGEINTEQNDVKVTTDEISFRLVPTSTPAKPKRVDVNKHGHENNNQVLTIKHNDADLKRLMDVKAKLESEADSRKKYGVELRKKKKRVTVEDEPPEYLHVPRRIYDGKQSLNYLTFCCCSL